MDYDINYIETSYNAEELHDIFIKEFIQFIDHTQEFTQLRTDTKAAAENYEWTK